MPIYTLNPSIVSHGVEAFRDCIRQYLGSADIARHDGTAVIPGAIAATIRAGITDERDIINIVSRVSRCREPKVSAILHGLADDEIAGRLWGHDETGTFYPRGNIGRAPALLMID
ncbi:MAG: hypothetical protein DI533_22425 [Cereibacter sphaeroides]|uniref:Uncharacterized protein n=1 Tax=Cereibacter sphaeroides TaxID=1063 RepID=A0A2W5U8V3_CERSP|nr:MAG: hypothetical protein DI533_22425 [Cereibacter sphaeroides]